MYAVTDDKSLYAVLDVGGDERGALALGRIAPAIAKEGDYEMIYVVNFYRPLTQDVESAIEVMREIEYACKLKFTSIVNNSNLGAETETEDVIKSLSKAKELSEKTGLPRLYTTVKDMTPELEKSEEKFRPISLQKHM